MGSQTQIAQHPPSRYVFHNSLFYLAVKFIDFFLKNYQQHSTVSISSGSISSIASSLTAGGSGTWSKGEHGKRNYFNLCIFFPPYYSTTIINLSESKYINQLQQSLRSVDLMVPDRSSQTQLPLATPSPESSSTSTSNSGSGSGKSEYTLIVLIIFKLSTINMLSID